MNKEHLEKFHKGKNTLHKKYKEKHNLCTFFKK